MKLYIDMFQIPAGFFPLICGSEQQLVVEVFHQTAQGSLAHAPAHKRRHIGWIQSKNMYRYRYVMVDVMFHKIPTARSVLPQTIRRRGTLAERFVA